MKTAGEILKEERIRQGYTLEKIEDAIKVRKKFLIAIEDDRYEELPAGAFAKGFVQNYAIFLGLDPEKTLAIFRRSFDESQEKKLLPKGLTEPLNKPPLVVTPTTVVVVLVLFCLTIFFGYLFHEYRSFVGAPFLLVEFPAENAKVQSETIDITGRTDSESKLRINGQEVPVSENGVFVQTVVLQDGVNALQIVAENKFQKKTTVTRHVILEPN